jgi:hypothetical protein
MPTGAADHRTISPIAILSAAANVVAWGLTQVPMVRDGDYLNLFGAVVCGLLAAATGVLVLVGKRSNRRSEVLAIVSLLFTTPIFCGLVGWCGFVRLLTAGR